MVIQTAVLLLDIQSEWQPTGLQMTELATSVYLTALQEQELSTCDLPDALGVYVIPIMNDLGNMESFIIYEVTLTRQQLLPCEAAFDANWPGGYKWLFKRKTPLPDN